MCLLTEEMLNDCVKSDSVYQELLQQCSLAEKQYCEIISSLSPKDREALERYISLCEELDFRKTTLALELQLLPRSL